MTQEEKNLCPVAVICEFLWRGLSWPRILHPSTLQSPPTEFLSLLSSPPQNKSCTSLTFILFFHFPEHGFLLQFHSYPFLVCYSAKLTYNQRIYWKYIRSYFLTSVVSSFHTWNSEKFNSCIKENTTYFLYKNQLLILFKVIIARLFQEPYKTDKCILWTKQRVSECYSKWYILVPFYFKGLTTISIFAIIFPGKWTTPGI